MTTLYVNLYDSIYINIIYTISIIIAYQLGKRSEILKKPEETQNKTQQQTKK